MDAEVDGDEYTDTGDIISFPSTLGITGSVFQSGQVYISNTAKTDRRFMPDIDNLSSSIEVDTFMIGPIYINDKPVGVIQLINK